MLEHAETLDDAREMVRQFKANGVVPSEVRQRKRFNAYALILFFVWMVAALVVALYAARL
ncbi:MAG: hypothetical protein ABJX32_11385 [Tateyamaria sp.]